MEEITETEEVVEETESEFTFEEETRAATAAGDFEYNTNSDGTITITKYSGKDIKVVIPQQIDGKNVTSIGDRAFFSCENLNSIEIPEGSDEHRKFCVC